MVSLYEFCCIVPVAPMARMAEKRTRSRRGDAAGRVSANSIRPGQRERLLASMVALASRQGYPAVSIAEISTHAGVSSATFYEQFADKEDCLLAAYQQAAAGVLERMPPLDSVADWQEASRTVVQRTARRPPGRPRRRTRAARRGARRWRACTRANASGPSRCSRYAPRNSSTPARAREERSTFPPTCCSARSAASSRRTSAPTARTAWRCWSTT